MTAEHQTAGRLVDALGVPLTIPEGIEFPTDAIVILRCATPDGEAVLRMGWSPNTDWITRRGLLDAALHEERFDSGVQETSDGLGE